MHIVRNLTARTQQGRAASTSCIAFSGSDKQGLLSGEAKDQYRRGCKLHKYAAIRSGHQPWKQ